MKVSIVFGIILVVAAVLAAAPPTGEPGTQTVLAGSSLPGDANCDGVVNSIDAAFVLQFSAGLLSTLPCPDSADVNGDGTVNSLDAALILQFAAGLLTTLDPSQPPTDTPPLVPTDTPQPTAVPTDTPQPTAMPTDTPQPTAVPSATMTPEETATITLPIVTILEPEDGSGLPPDQPFTLMGTATDPDQPITYEWRVQHLFSTAEVVIGTGANLSWTPSDHVPFVCGGHLVEISLYATDADGMTGSDSVSVTIGYPPC